MEDKIKKLISKIIEKAYEISTQTEHDVFITYFAHTNNLVIEICRNGWVYEQGEEERERMDISIKSATALNELEEVIEKLKEYEKGE